MSTERHLRSVSTPVARPRGRAVEPLWRDLAGRTLRERRTERGEKLVDTAARAGISPQYLSEIERGRKDPSSEVLAAVTGALDLTLVDLAVAVATAVLHPVPLAPARFPGGAQLSLAA